jgi:hypothetical protein
MKLHYFINIILLNLLLISWGFSQDISYLSDSDDDFKYIESLQKKYCENNNNLPLLECQTSYEECLEYSRYLSKLLFNDTTSNDSIREACNRVSTRYETPGFYRLLTNYYEQIENSAKKINFHLKRKPKVASLPTIKEVNVSVFSATSLKTPIIFINSLFYRFANEVIKATASTVPVSGSGIETSIDTNLSAFEEKIQNDPKLILTFRQTIFTFLEQRENPYYPPSPFVAQITNTFYRGIELFAMAHEYSHIALGHVESNDISRLESNTSINKVNRKEIAQDWVRELEADIWATKILRQIWQEEANDSTISRFDRTLINVPSFYFYTRYITENARSILSSGKELAPPRKFEGKIIEGAIACHFDSTCQLSKYLKEQEKLITGSLDHPHPLLRMMLVDSIFSSDIEANKENPMFSLSSLIFRNCSYLWAKTKPVLLKTYKESLTLKNK